MSSPLVSPEFGNLYVGDPKDDDAAVIDALVQEVDAPAEPVVEAVESVAEAPKRITQLLSGYFRFDNANPFSAPIQVLPADPDRKQFTVEVVSESATPAIITDFLFFADENGKVSSSASGRLYAGKRLTLDEHTGALYVSAGPSISAPLVLTYWSTTK